MKGVQNGKHSIYSNFCYFRSSRHSVCNSASVSTLYYYEQEKVYYLLFINMCYFRIYGKSLINKQEVLNKEQPLKLKNLLGFFSFMSFPPALHF